MKILIPILFGMLLLASPAEAQQSFDHFTTGFHLDGAHQNVSCDRCHSGAVFEGTNPTCAGCHSQIGLVQATMKPPNHISSSALCRELSYNVRLEPDCVYGPHGGVGKLQYLPQWNTSNRQTARPHHFRANNATIATQARSGFRPFSTMPTSLEIASVATMALTPPARTPRM